MKINNLIKVIEDNLNEIVNDLLNKDSDGFYSEKFNTMHLEDYQEDRYSPNNDPKFKYLFDDLDKKIKHCLYWFELKNSKKAEEYKAIELFPLQIRMKRVI